MALPALPLEQSDTAMKACALLATAAMHEVIGKKKLSVCGNDLIQTAQCDGTANSPQPFWLTAYITCRA